MFAKFRCVFQRSFAFQLLALCLLWGVASAQAAFAQTSCPNASVHGGTSPGWAYAYQTANRANGTCSNAVAIPANGSRMFASRADCRAGRFVFVGENGGGIVPSPFTCTNCTAKASRDAVIAPNSSAQISAYFTYSDGVRVRYTSTISRGPADVNGYTQCSISGATMTGGSYGGDATAPTASLGAVSGPVAGPFDVPVTLSEASTDLTLADFQLTNANAVLSGSGTNYTLSVSPVASGNWSAQIKNKSFTDAAGNLNIAASNVATGSFTATAPGVVIGAFSGPHSGAYTAAITLSAASTDFVQGDLTVSNGTATLAGSGANYTATVTPAGYGVVSLSVGAGRFTDAGGAANTASNVASITLVKPVVPPTPPKVLIGDLTGPVDGFFTAPITLSEPSSDFELADLTISNASANLAGSGKQYTVTLTPSGDGVVTLFVAAEAFTDVDGDANAASNKVQARYDATPPSVTISALSGPDAGVFTATITLSEPSDDFDADDLTLRNATAVLTGSGREYLATLTPNGDGEVSLSVAAGRFTDAAGNGNTASNSATTTYDATPPEITIAALTGPTAGTYTAVITLSEPSSNFALADLTLVNATATLTGTGTSFVATLTPIADGAVSLSVAAARFTDAAGNQNIASNSVAATYDGTAPTVAITGAPGTSVPFNPFTVTVTFSEPVIGFAAEGMIATNATVTALTGGGAVYQATVKGKGSGDIALSVPANAASDAAGNANLASDVTMIVDMTVVRTQELIAGYMQTRANQLLQSQPDLIGFLSGEGQGGFNLNVTRGQGSFDFATAPEKPVWLRAHGTWSKAGERKSEYAFGAVGTHRAIGENFLVGAMVQLDHLNEETGAAFVRGTGWMAGPYFVARAEGQPVFFEGRLLYGETSNEISPFGTYTDKFETTRMLAQVKVAGALAYGSTTLMPFLDASYTTDDQLSYVDGAGNTIAAQGVELGQVELGLDFRKLVSGVPGELELFGGLSGIWSHTAGSGFASTITPEYEGGRGRVELGVNRVFKAGQRVRLSANYDGIGAKGFESYGVNFGYEMQF